MASMALATMKEAGGTVIDRDVRRGDTWDRPKKEGSSKPYTKEAIKWMADNGITPPGEQPKALPAPQETPADKAAPKRTRGKSKAKSDPEPMPPPKVVPDPVRIEMVFPTLGAIREDASNLVVDEETGIISIWYSDDFEPKFIPARGAEITIKSLDDPNQPDLECHSPGVHVDNQLGTRVTILLTKNTQR